MKKLTLSVLIALALIGQLMAQYQDEVLVTQARDAIKKFNIVSADSAYKAAMKAAPDEERYNEIQSEWGILEQINVRLTDGSRALSRNDYDDAFKKYGEAIAQMDASPLDIWGRFKGEAYYSMGMVHFRKEEPIDAAGKFREAIQYDPATEKYGKAIQMVRNKHYTEGHKFLKRKDFESARSEYEKSVAVDPTFASGYYQLAYIAKRSGNLKQAEGFYLEAVTSDGTHYKAWYGLGNLYSEMGNNAKAIESLKTSVSINPQYEKAYYVLGKVYESQKSSAQAIANLKKASKTLAGKDVAVKAEVTKVLPKIMGKTWVHLKDGDGEESTLVVTTQAQNIPLGSHVTILGKVSVDKDFGMGYFYACMIEDAAVIF